MHEYASQTKQVERREELITLINNFINTPMGTSISGFIDEYLKVK
jgi:hypothetical protein